MTNYDIYVPKGLNSSLDLQTMIQIILEENDIHLQAEDDIHLEGFIGLEVSDTLAKKIWERLKSQGAKSVVAPSRYGQAPLLTINEARHFARLVVEQKKVQDPILVYICDILQETCRGEEIAKLIFHQDR